ncbi:MAG: FAA hydrolase family protein [Flavobacteriales bacterium]|nr:FAA hydrolase family protein [Flavobacteriales bacterium]NCA22747.1 FAA hydrolase family protein [Crocinitomicaceae bacterium]
MKIICIGRNYAEHAKEMNSAIPSEPIFFMKPDVALLKEKEFYYPNFSKDLHFECEIVVKIDKVGKNIDANFAHKYYSEFTLGIDFTARDLQAQCKEKGLPWEKAKAFDNSAPISQTWIKFSDVDFATTTFSFFQNGELKQLGKTEDMIFSIDQLIAYVSQYVTLKTGDLIYTGTPSGVGAVKIGDVLTAELNDQKLFEFHVK